MNVKLATSRSDGRPEPQVRASQPALWQQNADFAVICMAAGQPNAGDANRAASSVNGAYTIGAFAAKADDGNQQNDHHVDTRQRRCHRAFRTHHRRAEFSKSVPNCQKIHQIGADHGK
jgi:uncharacterized protein YcfJ